MRIDLKGQSDRKSFGKEGTEYQNKLTMALKLWPLWSPGRIDSAMGKQLHIKNEIKEKMCTHTTINAIKQICKNSDHLCAIKSIITSKAPYFSHLSWNISFTREVATTYPLAQREIARKALPSQADVSTETTSEHVKQQTDDKSPTTLVNVGQHCWQQCHHGGTRQGGQYGWRRRLVSMQKREDSRRRGRLTVSIGKRRCMACR